MLEVGQVVETSSGWLLDIEEIQWWSNDDGAAYGRAMAGSSTRHKWTPTKYLGTVKVHRKEWPTQWWRICTKCEATQLRYSDTEPENK